MNIWNNRLLIVALPGMGATTFQHDNGQFVEYETVGKEILKYEYALLTDVNAYLDIIPHWKGFVLYLRLPSYEVYIDRQVKNRPEHQVTKYFGQHKDKYICADKYMSQHADMVVNLAPFEYISDLKYRLILNYWIR